MSVAVSYQQTIAEYEAQAELLRRQVEEKEHAVQKIMALHEAARKKQRSLIAEQGQLIDLLRFALEGNLAGVMPGAGSAAGFGGGLIGMKGEHHIGAPPGLGANMAPAQESVPRSKWFSGCISGIQTENAFAKAAGLPGVHLPAYISTASSRESLRACATATSVLDHDAAHQVLLGGHDQDARTRHLMSLPNVQAGVVAL